MELSVTLVDVNPVVDGINELGDVVIATGLVKSLYKTVPDTFLNERSL